MRILIRDLQPGTQYGVQLRSSAGETTSEWSRKFTFQSDQNMTAPAVPTGLTWVVAGDSFHAEWNPVTLRTDGNPSKIVNYEVELTAASTTRTVSVAPKSTAPVTFDLPFEANRALFGTPQGNISIRVRAVDNAGVGGAFTSSVNAQNAPPSAPSSITAT